MKISKSDALNWFRFFSALPDDEPLGVRQQEIAAPEKEDGAERISTVNEMVKVVFNKM